MTSYSPLGQGSVLKEAIVQDIAGAHGVDPCQVIIRWHIQQPGVVAIPRSSNPEHIRLNNDVHDFILTPEEMGRIS